MFKIIYISCAILFLFKKEINNKNACFLFYSFMWVRLYVYVYVYICKYIYKKIDKETKNKNKRKTAVK